MAAPARPRRRSATARASVTSSVRMRSVTAQPAGHRAGTGRGGRRPWPGTGTSLRSAGGGVADASAVHRLGAEVAADEVGCLRLELPPASLDSKLTSSEFSPFRQSRHSNSQNERFCRSKRPRRRSHQLGADHARPGRHRMCRSCLACASKRGDCGSRRRHVEASDIGHGSRRPATATTVLPIFAASVWRFSCRGIRLSPDPLALGSVVNAGSGIGCHTFDCIHDALLTEGAARPNLWHFAPPQPAAKGLFRIDR